MSTDNLKTGKRLTLVMNHDILKALRKIQAKKIAQADSSVSFSHVVNEQLRKCLKL